MSNEYDDAAFKAMGAILMLLPFRTSLNYLYADSFTEEEEVALHGALKVAVTVLMTARKDYQLGPEAIGACAAGVASELVRIFIAGRIKHKPLKQRMQVDGHEWELMFDPGLSKERLRTDEKGRVWQKLQAGFFDDSDDDLLF